MVSQFSARSEESHREIKQLTGIESCQCRKALLKNLASKTGETVYKIEHNLLSNYLIEQLKRPDIAMFSV